MFDKHIKQLASPTKVAFICGFVVGFAAGHYTRFFRGQLLDTHSAWKRSRTRIPARTLQPLNGTFEEKKNEILPSLKNIFTDDNKRFDRLRHFVECTDEFAENDVESLMSNVSRNMMTDYKPEFGIANFFATVVKFIQTEQDIEQATRMELEKKANDLTRRCFDADILIINAADDNELAIKIGEEIKGWNISVDIEFEVSMGKTVFSSIGDALNRYLFVFVIVTENLAGDQMQRFVSEGHLRQSVLDNRYRFIPVKIYGQDHDDPVLGILNSWTYGTERSGENLNNLVQRAKCIVFN